MLYDPFGRPCHNTEVSGTISANIIGITFAGASHIRIKNGRLQLKNDTDNLWYYVYLQNDPGSGQPVFSPADTGEIS